MWRTHLWTVLLAMLLLLSACNDRSAEPTPTPTTAPTVVNAESGSPSAPVANPSPTTPVEPTATLAATPVAATATVTAQTIPATAVATATAAPEFAQARLLQPLNIRSGPGTAYPAVGVLAADVQVEILAQSADEAWWQIECPAVLDVDQCWITSSSLFSEAMISVALSTAPAPPVPPTPLPTATATPTPCVVSPPSGWVRYQVVAGDTLSDLASRSGASVDSLRRVNCLPSDTIRSGAYLNVPAGIRPPEPRSTDVAAPPSRGVPPSGVAAILDNTSPNGGSACRLPAFAPLPPGQVKGISIVPAACQDRNSVWEIGQQICIYAKGLDNTQPVTLTVTPPNGEPSQYLLSTANQSFIWTMLPDEPHGQYHISATQANESIEDSFEVTNASRPRILVMDKLPVRGTTVTVALAGFDSNPPLFLYRFLNLKWKPILQLPPSQLADDQGYYQVPVPDENGQYAIHTGEETGLCGLADPRVFVVK